MRKDGLVTNDSNGEAYRLSGPLALDYELGSPRGWIRSFYDDIVGYNWPSALEQLTKLKYITESRFDDERIIHYFQTIRELCGDVGFNELSSERSIPHVCDVDYARCLLFYRSGNFAEAFRESRKILFMNRWKLPDELADIVDVVIPSHIQGSPSFLSRDMGRIILLHAAILHRLGYEMRAHATYDRLSKLPSAVLEIASCNCDIIQSGKINGTIYSDFAKSNELITLARAGRTHEILSLLARLREGEFQFKGSLTDLKFIETLAGIRKDEPISVLFLEARSHFEKRDWKMTQRILCRARELVNVSSPEFRIINFNHALTCMCLCEYDKALRIFETMEVSATPSTFVSLYCTALIMSDATEKAAELMASLPRETVSKVNLDLARLYCSQNNWEFGLLRLIESNGDWVVTKQIILGFLMVVSEGRVRCNQFQDWNSVMGGLVQFLKRNENKQGVILCKLVERLILPTVAAY